MTAVASSFRELAVYMGKRAPLLIARKVVEIAFGLVTIAVLARTLPKHEFAIYSLLLSFLSIARLTALPGLGLSITQSFARGARGGYRRAVALSVTGSLAGSLLLVIAGIWHLSVEQTGAGQMLLVASAFFPLVGGLMLWRDAAAGEEAYAWFLYFEGASAALKCAAVAACAFLYPGLLLPAVIASLAAPAACNLVATIRQWNQVPTTSSGEANSTSYGIKVSLYQLPTVLSQQLDRLVLFYLISPEALATYAVALRIPELARAFVGDTNATLGPLFARTPTYSAEIHSFSLKLWSLYFAISVIGAVAVVPWLLPLLFGSRYVDVVPLAQVMTAGVAFEFLGNLQFRFIKSRLHSASFLRVTLPTALFETITILTLALSFGLWGVVAAYVIKGVVYSAITNHVVRKSHGY